MCTIIITDILGISVYCVGLMYNVMKCTYWLKWISYHVVKRVRVLDIALQICGQITKFDGEGCTVATKGNSAA